MAVSSSHFLRSPQLNPCKSPLPASEEKCLLSNNIHNDSWHLNTLQPELLSTCHDTQCNINKDTERKVNPEPPLTVKCAIFQRTLWNRSVRRNYIAIGNMETLRWKRDADEQRVTGSNPRTNTRDEARWWVILGPSFWTTSIFFDDFYLLTLYCVGINQTWSRELYNLESSLESDY